MLVFKKKKKKKIGEKHCSLGVADFIHKQKETSLTAPGLG